MEEYFEKGDVSVETLKRCIKKGAISGEFRPVLCGTAFKNKGVQPLLDGIVDYLPLLTTLKAFVALRRKVKKKTKAHSPSCRLTPMASLLVWRSRSSTTNTAR